MANIDFFIFFTIFAANISTPHKEKKNAIQKIT